MWNHEAFTKGAAQDFVLLSLDFSSDGTPAAGVANPARHTELMQKYEIRGFPTVLLMTAEGEVFAQTGYEGMSPEEYLAHVRDLRAKGKKEIEDAKALAAEYEKAKDKVAVIRQAITAMNSAGEGAPAGTVLAEIVRKGLALDPENKSGLKMDCIRVLVLQGYAAPGERTLALELDPKNELGLMEAVVSGELERMGSEEDKDRFLAHVKILLDAGKVHKADKVAICFANAAYFINKDQSNAEQAKLFARKALDLGGLPDQVVPMMKEILGEQ